MSRLRRLLPTLAAAALIAGVPGLRGVDAGEGGVPAEVAELLARADAGRGNFAAVVEIEWHDTDGAIHTERVRVQRRDGIVVVDGARDVRATTTGRFVEGAQGWMSIGGVPGASEVPHAAAEWQLEMTGDRQKIAGVATFEVEAVDVDTGLVRQRLFLAPRAPFLFQREILDENGDVLRAVHLVRLRPAPDIVDPPPDDYAVEEPDSLAEPPGDVPETAGDGFHLVGAYELDDGVAHLVYSDGLFGVSVFVDEGELDTDALPAGAATAAVDGEDVRAYATAAGDVLIWQDDDDRVLAWVSDAPPDQLMGVAASFTGDDDPGVWGRAADVVLGPFAWR
ncbi:MAG: hypothetical protein ACRDWD_07050 [Acidimicrobiia bacterium]